MMLIRVLGLVSVISWPACAQDHITDEKLQKFYSDFYSSQESHSKSMFDELMAIYMKTPSEGLTEAKRRKAFTHLSSTRTYQSLIDLMFCAETAMDRLEACFRARSLNFQAMRQFILDYDRLTDVVSVCETKSRMMELEQKYPPFDFMVSDKAPRSYDGEVFLFCARSKL